MKNLSFAVPLVLLASACTWVNVSDGADDIVVGREANVRGCDRLSETNVKVADRLGPVHRSSDKVAEELLTLGKNEAVRLGGDTIVPKGPPDDGRQTFIVYNCD